MEEAVVVSTAVVKLLYVGFVLLESVLSPSTKRAWIFGKIRTGKLSFIKASPRKKPKKMPRQCVTKRYSSEALLCPL